MALRSDLHGQELVAVKDGAPAEALRREAALLAELDHPGVIRFVALTEDEHGLRLLTRYAGRDTLATWQPQRLEELRRAIEDLAGTVRHLHERGVVHGAIRPGHVVIDALRRPLLCGFSTARRVAAAPGTPADRTCGPSGPVGGDGDLDPEGSGGEGVPGRDDEIDTAGEQLADVVAIGETVLATLQRLEGNKPRAGRRRDDPRLGERLAAVAQAAAGGRVPTARALAGQIQALRTAGDAERAPGSGGGPAHRPQPADVRLRAPAAGRPMWFPNLRSVSPTPPSRRAGRVLRRPPRRATLLAAATVCAGCALGTLMVVHLGGEATPAAGVSDRTLTGARATVTPVPPDRAPGGRGAPVIPDAAMRSGPARAPAPVRDAAGCAAVAGGLRDVTGDGCAEEVHVGAGFVSIDGARYPVGESGDQVAVGDWDCDGVATVALVQPGGRVYVFDGWPREVPLVGRLVADLTPPVELADVPRGACNELLVRYAGGTWYLPLPVALSE